MCITRKIKPNIYITNIHNTKKYYRHYLKQYLNIDTLKNFTIL